MSMIYSNKITQKISNHNFLIFITINFFLTIKKLEKSIQFPINGRKVLAQIKKKHNFEVKSSAHSPNRIPGDDEVG